MKFQKRWYSLVLTVCCFCLMLTVFSSTALAAESADAINFAETYGIEIADGSYVEVTFSFPVCDIIIPIYKDTSKVDIGVFMIENAKVIIDEAGIEYNNRSYKSFPSESIYFYKYHRHYKVSVDVFSQSYDDMDVTLRRLAQNFYVVRRSLVPFCIVARRIRRKVGVDEQTKQITDLYSMGIPVFDTKRIFSPPLWKLFNSYSRKELPQKDWPVW